MEISWFEIGAQIFNFFLLLFILQYFFYKPVTKAMANRQERISKSEKKSNRKMDEAEELIKKYDNKILEIESEKKIILSDYRKEALDTKESLLKEYQEEASNKRKSFMNEVEEEKEYFIENLRQELGRSAVKIASKILSTITSQELEDEVYGSFINDLRNLKENIPNSEILDEVRYITVSSSSELSTTRKTGIERILSESIPNIESVTYEINEDLVLGFEVNLETYTIHSSIKNYLDEMEDTITKVLDKQNL